MASLTSPLTESATTAYLDEAASSDSSYQAQIDDELVQVTSGGDGLTPTITRGAGISVAVAHSAGATFSPVTTTLRAVEIDLSSGSVIITGLGTAVPDVNGTVYVDADGFLKVYAAE